MLATGADPAVNGMIGNVSLERQAMVPAYNIENLSFLLWREVIISFL